MITHNKTSMIPQAYAEEFGYGYLLGFEELWSGDYGLKLCRYNKRNDSSEISVFDVKDKIPAQFRSELTNKHMPLSVENLTDSSHIKTEDNAKWFYVSKAVVGNCKVNGLPSLLFSTRLPALYGIIDWYILKDGATDVTVAKHLILKVKYREAIIIDEPEVYGLDFLVEDNTFKTHVDDISRSYFIGSIAILDVDMSKLRNNPFKLVIKNNLSINKLPSGDS